MTHTLDGTPRPGAKLDLRFTADDWSTMNWPIFLRPFGFTHRFEVIQDTFIEGVPDWHVDRALWLRLAEFIGLEGKNHRVLVVPDLLRAGFSDHRVVATLASLAPGAAMRALVKIEKHGVQLADFLSADGPDAQGDWDPPDAIFIVDGDAIRMAMNTDRYYLIGGQELHHDSATYAFHARRDISGAVIAFLQLAPGASAWNFDMLVRLPGLG